MRTGGVSRRGARRLLGVALLGAFLPLATLGCFGKFQLVRKVYRYNKQVDPDKWIQWFVFLVFNVVPVYGIAAMIDALFANSVEFWTGENPIQAAVGTEKVVRGPDGEVATLRWVAEDRVEVSVVGGVGALAHFSVRSEADALSAWDAQGRLLARVTEVAGVPLLVAAPGL